MQKMIGMLAVLLAAQLVLAVAMSFTGPNLDAVPPDTPLVNLGDRSVNRLTIAGPDKQPLVLAKQGEGWVLPDSGGFPADKAKVNSLLDRLKGLKRGFAVATTEGAQKRFKVSDDNFERRVVLARGDDTLATLYFGTSPGLRRVHVRTSGDAAVYTTGFGLYDAPLDPGEWEDRTVLQMPLGEIARISLADLVLTRVPGQQAGAASTKGDQPKGGKATWSAAGLAEGETVNQAHAGALAQKLADLTVGPVLGSEAKPGYGLQAPQLLLSIQRKDGKAVEYRLGKRDKEHDYVLKVSSRPEYFRLAGTAADDLLKAARRAQLVTMKAAGVTGATAQDPVAAGQPGGTATPQRNTSGYPRPVAGGSDRR